MKFIVVIVLLCVSKDFIFAVKLPGPLVYVVTPASKTKAEQGRASTFYYNNWMRRMDSPRNMTPTTTTTTMKPTTSPDLIFAEFESGSGMHKSLRKLLENERAKIKAITTTTMKPIQVVDETESEMNEKNHEDKYYSSSDMEDYFASYSPKDNPPSPVYYSSTPDPFATTTTTTESPMKVENIWHIIDNEKYNQYNGGWEEVSPNKDESQENTKLNSEETHLGGIDENFAVPGFTTNVMKGGENESRAIRTEPKFQFPYVSLKPFQMKTSKNPTSNKGNNMVNLDNFKDMKYPVRGEAQDVAYNRDPIDRYNPAQPYLPQYSVHAKQTYSKHAPSKAVGTLVPPPPPPPPKITDDDFPSPSSYDSFPPYASADPDSPEPPASSADPPPVEYKQPNKDSYLNKPMMDDTPMDLGYRYKAPSLNFVPTLPPPPAKPFNGYSYDKPILDEPAPTMDKPESGYQYPKPETKLPDPAPTDVHPPSYGPDHGYHYPQPDHYPEVVYDKPYKGMKGGDDMKSYGVDMAPPPPDMKQHDDHGFPSDFPGDFKYHHDFEDSYHDHHHEHTTPPPTTEMPRVNRFSYYYLGKKLYYLPLYFSVYFIIYVGALIIKAVLRHKIVYPNSWRPNDQTAGFFSKRSVDSWDLSHDRLQEITGTVTKAIAVAAEKYMDSKTKHE